MHTNWSILPKDDVKPHWAGAYVTLNRYGTIAMNKVTHRRIGEPAAVLIMFDRANSRIALRPTGVMTKHAYAVGKYGRHGGRRIRAFRMMTEFGIKVTETIEFTDAEVDKDGHLILDLRTARISPRAGSRNRKSFSTTK